MVNRPLWLKPAAVAVLVLGTGVFGLGVSGHWQGGGAPENKPERGTGSGTGTGLPFVLPPTAMPEVRVVAETAPATQPAVAYAAGDTAGLTKAAEAKEFVAVTGVVEKVEVSRTGKVAKILFKDVPADKGFYAAFFPAVFEEMEKAFGGKAGAELAGKTVTVTGKAEIYRGQPQVVVRAVGQVVTEK